MTNPAKCHCGSISWERNIKETRFTCCSCKRPLWQPIETAPKDRWILAYQPNGSHGGMAFTGGHCYVCRWAYKNEFWYDKTSNVLEEPPPAEKIITYFTCTPTHWMPLPEGPGND